MAILNGLHVLTSSKIKDRRKTELNDYATNSLNFAVSQRPQLMLFKNICKCLPAEVADEIRLDGAQIYGQTLKALVRGNSDI